MSVSRSAAHRLTATAAASLVALAFGASWVEAATTDDVHEDLTVALGPNVEKLPSGLY